jgi:hypothetical protein
MSTCPGPVPAPVATVLYKSQKIAAVATRSGDADTSLEVQLWRASWIAAIDLHLAWLLLSSSSDRLELLDLNFTLMEPLRPASSR